MTILEKLEEEKKKRKKKLWTTQISHLEKKNLFKSCILRSWYNKICIHSRAVSPRVEDNNALKYSYDNFYNASQTLRTTLHWVVFLQSREEGHETLKKNKILDKSVSFLS